MEIAELFATLGLKPDTKSWESGSKMISGVKKALGGLVAAAAVWKGIGMVEDVIDLGGHLNDTSQKIGVSAEALQELGYAAKLNSSNIDDVAGALTKLGKNIDEALVTRKGPAVDALKRLGISMDDPAIKSRNLDQALMKIADRMAHMPDGPKKIALAMDLFGKAGADLIPTLNQGADGLKELRKEAVDLGIVLDNKTVGGLDDLGDNVDRLKMTLGGLKNQAVAALLPMLSDMATATLTWVKANQGIIKSTLTTVVTGIAKALQFLGSVVGVVVEIIDWMGEHMDFTKALFIAIGIVLGMVAAEAVVAWLAIAGPVIAVIAVITALVLIFQDLYRSVTTGKGKFADAFRYITRQVKDWWHDVKKGAQDVADWFYDVPNKITAAFNAAAQKIKEVWGEVLDWVKHKADGLLDNKVIKIGAMIAGVNVDAFQAQAHAMDPSLRTDTENQLAGDMPIGTGMAGGGPHVGSSLGGGTRPYAPKAAPDINIVNNVTSPNADPKVVAGLVSDGFSAEWDKKMRHASFDTGGGDQ